MWWCVGRLSSYKHVASVFLGYEAGWCSAGTSIELLTRLPGTLKRSEEEEHRVASKSPQQVIRDSLSAQRSVVASPRVQGTTGWRAETSRGGLDAKPETLQFGKTRSIPFGEIHAVTFETQTGQRLRFVCYVRQDKVGEWQFVGGAGGGVNGDPRRGHPWVNLGGGGWPKQFYAGGQVLEHAGRVVRVRLRAANGTVLEDSVEDGMVLFLTDKEVHPPVYAELVDPSGQIVSQHRALG